MSDGINVESSTSRKQDGAFAMLVVMVEEEAGVPVSGAGEGLGFVSDGCCKRCSSIEKLR